MELTSRMKWQDFKPFGSRCGKNKPLDESRKTDQTSWTKMAFYSIFFYQDNKLYIYIFFFSLLGQENLNVCTFVCNYFQK
ncbi:hypothetical protein Hanom_Chr13g01239301 [Helianthus anomalus]